MFILQFGMYAAIAYLVIALLATWWVYSDASKNQFMPWLWSLITLFFFPIGFIAYLVFKAIEYTREKV